MDAMPLQIINTISDNNYISSIASVQSALLAGALVVLPTETLYGIAGNAASTTAIARLRQVLPLAGASFTVHLPRPSSARDFVTAPTPLLRRFARKAWPGPLTLICRVDHPQQSPIAKRFPAAVPAVFEEHTVSLRCPSHPIFQQIAGGVDAPMVVSAPGRPGAAPAHTADAALQQAGPEIEFAIDAGPTPLRTASTVIEVRENAWTLRRPGAIDERTLARLARSEILFVCTGNSCRSPMAEFMFRRMLSERLGLSAEALADAGYFVSSAGLAAGIGMSASRGTLDELSRRGLDARGHRSQPLTIELAQRAERIFVMTPEHRAGVLDLLPSAGDRVALLDPRGTIPDPMGGGPADYAAAAEQIEQACRTRVEEFVHEDLDW